MFQFLKRSTGRVDDPLRSPRSAFAWFQELPTSDLMERQHHVLVAFDAMRQACQPVDRERLSAIELVDAAFDQDRSRLLAEYMARVARGAAMSDRIWEVVRETNRGFVCAYEAALDRALANIATARWRCLIPLLTARLIRCHGIDATLRAFRYQQAIPANWLALHELYRR